MAEEPAARREARAAGKAEAAPRMPAADRAVQPVSGAFPVAWAVVRAALLDPRGPGPGVPVGRVGRAVMPASAEPPAAEAREPEERRGRAAARAALTAVRASTA